MGKFWTFKIERSKNMETINEYEKQAQKFLEQTQTIFKAELVGHDKYFSEDKESRDIYKITLERKGKKPFVFRFGQSIVHSAVNLKGDYQTSASFQRSGHYMPRKDSDFARKRKAPTAYSVLACLTKYDIGTLENFCAD